MSQQQIDRYTDGLCAHCHSACTTGMRLWNILATYSRYVHEYALCHVTYVITHAYLFCIVESAISKPYFIYASHVLVLPLALSLLDEYHQKLTARDDIRRSLDEAWKQSLLKRKEREADAERHEEAPSILLHQQCERYKRCKQCQRRTSNAGGSNVLAESRYISGARLMV